MIGKCEQCGFYSEFINIKDGRCLACTSNSPKNEFKPRSKPQKIAFIAFRVLGIIAISLSWVATWESGQLLVAIGFMLALIGIPIMLGVILGPGLSLFVGWNDRNLMFMTGISILLVVLLVVLEELAVTPRLQANIIVILLLAYGVACMTIGAKWITKMKITKMNENIQRSDVTPTDRKVSCPRCYAFVPGDQPNCTSCGKPLR
jgi:hypothetical protein